MNKKELALILSRLKSFEKAKVEYEQYQTPSELAADALWHAYMEGNITGKKITDLGCGTGILGIGALALGAKRVVFVDADEEALKTAMENLLHAEKILKKKLNAKFENKDIIEYKGRSDVVIENPPFGVKNPHIDKSFLQKAMKIANTIYSFHKIESKDFIERFARDNGFRVENITDIRFPLKAIFRFHRKKNYFVKTGLWKIVKYERHAWKR